MFPPKLGCGTSAALRYNQNGFVGLQSSNVSTKIATTSQIVCSFTGFFIYDLRVFHTQFTGFLYTIYGFFFIYIYGFLYTFTGFLYTFTGFFIYSYGFFYIHLRDFLYTFYGFFMYFIYFLNIFIVMFPPKLGCGTSAALRYNQNWLALLLSGNGSSRIGPQDLCRVMLPAELAGAGGE
jgi:hypothetical protein